MLSGVVRKRATSSEADPPADAAAVRARVAELLAAGPRKARTVRDALVAQLRATPSLRAALPAPADVPEAHRRAIVDAHAAALMAARDGEGLRALVASLDGALAWGVVMAAGNARELAPLAPVAAHALERDEPDVRLAGVYFVRRWLAAGGEVAPLAAGLVRAAVDDRRGEAIKDKVATPAREAIREAAQRPAARDAIAAAVAGVEPASTRRALEKLLGDGAAPPPPRTVAEAVRALRGGAAQQKLGLAYLTAALVQDMVDVRAAFSLVSQLLASDDEKVREAAAALAYYGADLQGATEEAQRMRGALEARLGAGEMAGAGEAEGAGAGEASRRVREHVEAAIRALERGREGRTQ